jgi:hypothetical protein
VLLRSPGQQSEDGRFYQRVIFSVTGGPRTPAID